ncbi:MAG TPA: prephenate dehydrogenase/arogenate dehydrogenase family protein [Candidatus Baltobacteraceae bacterium]|jgi:prephenate dehydrogenase|nr:prephenate dehydrogenase/arogenate dehydrogenase family protein [Candidatus Baltobacteraceae bacterium]
MNAPRTLGILGTGLIGASIGMRARREGFRVLGSDRDPGAVFSAVEYGCIDEACARERIYDESDIVVLAMPLDAVIAEIESLAAAHLRRPPAILDVASVKGPVVRAARALTGFVGTHPMAGGEGSGPSSASAALFDGRTWAYVPSHDADSTAIVANFIAAMGAHPIPVDADVHDATVACTSHMPQIFAWLFAERVRALSDPGANQLYGPVARELMRIGEVRAPFWASVLQANAANVSRELRTMAAALENYILNTP